MRLDMEGEASTIIPVATLGVLRIKFGKTGAKPRRYGGKASVSALSCFPADNDSSSLCAGSAPDKIRGSRGEASFLFFFVT